MSTTPTEPADEPIDDDWTPDLGVSDFGAPSLEELFDVDRD